MTVSETLVAALEKFNGGKNWVKGRFRVGEKACAMEMPRTIKLGAICAPQLNQATRSLHALPKWCSEATIWFNDRPETTFSDIEALYHKAIDLAQQEERTHGGT